MHTVLALVVSLSVAAPCHPGGPFSTSAETTKQSDTFWLIGGAAGWFQVGTGTGLLIATAFPHNRFEATEPFAVGALVGALVGTGVGLLLGWAASQNSLPAQLAVLAPLAVDLIAAIVVGGLFLGHGGGCDW